VDRLLGLSTPPGQLESMREQLAATQRASAYAKPTNKARFLAEISALEQQIATLEAAQQQEHVVHERIASSLERERRPSTERQSEPIARLRIVNAPPLPVPRYFENRYIETGLIGDFLCDPAACILTVHGRGGVGKTALVCRVLRELENDVLPDGGGTLKVAAVVYVNATRASSSLFPQLLSGLFLTLDKNLQDELRPVLENPNGTVATKLKELLPRLSRDPTVVLLDNFEDVLSPEDARIRDAEISELVQLLPELPQHSLKIIMTTRIVPDEVLRISPVRHMRISLSDGLASPYAERVLREIDSDGSAGLRAAPDTTLSAVAAETRGFPRALEAFYSIIAADPSKEIDDVLADLRSAAHPAERLTQVLVGEAYTRLLPIDQKVMQAVAIYGRPVSLTAVEYLLDDWAPYVDSAAVVRRLVAMHFVRREGRAYYLHPIDRDHSLSFLSDAEKHRLRRRAGDYYREIERPRSEWKALADLEPHLEQFRLRLEAGDAETAASILDDIADFLDKRGAFEQALALALTLNRSTSDEDITCSVLEHIATAQWRLGRFVEAVAAQERRVEILSQDESAGDLFIANGNLLIYRQALGTTDELLESFREYLAEFERRRPWDTKDLATCLSQVAECFEELGHLNEALLHQQRATDLALQSSDPDYREAQIHNLGVRNEALGDTQRAEELYRQALTLADESENPLWKANHLAALASCAQSQGRFDEALQHIARALEIRHQIGDLGGIASNTRQQSEVLLTLGEVDRAADTAVKTYQQARDLKLPLREYCRVCAETSITQGKVAEAYRLLTEQRDDHPGSRWDFDNVLGTVLLRQRRLEEARHAFTRALGQSDVWLSRSSANQNARAGKALALAGLAACGQADALRRAQEEYRAAMGPDTGMGTIAEWRRRLEQLAVGVKPDLLGEILSDVFGPQAPRGGATLLQNERSQVFISYAHEDKPWVEKLTKVLSPAIRNNKVDVWYDAKIKPGQEWRQEIETALSRARVGVLLVSPDFLASNFIAEEELPFLLQAAKQRGVKLVWIYVAPCLVEETPLIALQCAHAYDQPLDSLAQHELSQCLVDIAREIRTAYENP
jgi:tetratricopeptide (TPR) repeat protein